MALVASVLALMMPAPAVAQPVHSDAAYEQAPRRDYKARHKGCNTRSCDRRMDKKVRKRVHDRKWRLVKPHNAKLNRMAQCESGGRWHIDGEFDGGLQFHPSTWRAAGGTGFAYQHTILEQKYRAVLWMKKIGTWVTTAGWPVCGYK